MWNTIYNWFFSPATGGASVPTVPMQTAKQSQVQAVVDSLFTALETKFAGYPLLLFCLEGLQLLADNLVDQIAANAGLVSPRQVVDYLFQLLGTAVASDPLLHFGLEMVQQVADGLIDKLFPPAPVPTPPVPVQTPTPAVAPAA